MNYINKIIFAVAIATSLLYTGCKTPALEQSPGIKAPPSTFSTSQDTTNSGRIQWKKFFADQNLVSLIDTALKNNQELGITWQEIQIARNDIRFRQSRLFPTVEAGGGIGMEKVGRYTSQGAGDASTDIKPGKEVPEWLPDYRIGLSANWEVDIWKKLRNAKKAAVTRYFATVEGRNFVITNLVAEVANSYYELIALDNQLDIVQQSIQLQQNALEIVKVQKQYARATELAVKKFEADVLSSQGLQYSIQQRIRETENKINFLLGHYPQPIVREKAAFVNVVPQQVYAGIPSQLMNARPDIRQAELELSAAKLDVKVAKAEFYPSFTISGGLGFQAFNPTYLVKFPESVLFSLAGDLAGPLINKNAIKAEYYSANARQIQAVYNYQRTVLNAYIEVSNTLSNISNLEQAYNFKSKEVDTLVATIAISNDLFKSARADYLEVLLTQRDVLESKLELIETKLQQLTSVTKIYQALGGGWN